MATDSTSIKGPVTVNQDSKERVAYDLMLHVAGFENSPKRASEPRQYVLDLYAQCLRAVSGYSHSES